MNRKRKVDIASLVFGLCISILGGYLITNSKSLSETGVVLHGLFVIPAGIGFFMAFAFGNILPVYLLLFAFWFSMGQLIFMVYWERKEFSRIRFYIFATILVGMYLIGFFVYPSLFKPID